MEFHAALAAIVRSKQRSGHKFGSAQPRHIAKSVDFSPDVAQPLLSTKLAISQSNDQLMQTIVSTRDGRLSDLHFSA